MSRRPTAVHRELDAEMTRCGEHVEALETAVTSGTREYRLQTTTDPDKVTCKRCLRSLECEAARSA